MCLKRVYVHQMSFLEGSDGSDFSIVISDGRIRLRLLGSFEIAFFHFSSRNRLPLLSGWPLGLAQAADAQWGSFSASRCRFPIKSELLDGAFELPAAGFSSEVSSSNVDLSFPLQDSHQK